MKLKSQDTHSLFVEGVPASKQTNKQNETFFGDSLEKIISDFKGVLVPMCYGTPWARVANFVKKPSPIFNVTYLESNGFNASMWVS